MIESWRGKFWSYAVHVVIFPCALFAWLAIVVAAATFEPPATSTYDVLAEVILAGRQ